MITVMAQIRAEDWDHFKAVHDQPARLQLRRNRGNISHTVLNQLDDQTDVIFFDTWSSPQDSDSYYHSDEFQRDLADMRATLIQIVKLERTDAQSLTDDSNPAIQLG